jgi:hypothetical protein
MRDYLYVRVQWNHRELLVFGRDLAERSVECELPPKRRVSLSGLTELWRKFSMAVLLNGTISVLNGIEPTADSDTLSSAFSAKRIRADGACLLSYNVEPQHPLSFPQGVPAFHSHSANAKCIDEIETDEGE